MKKILFIGDNWFGDLGGRKRIVLSLINFMTRNNYDVYLLTIDTKIKEENIKDMKENLENNVKIHSFFFPRNFLFYLKLFFLFGIKIFKIRPHLTICFGGGPYSNAIFFYITKITYPLTKIIFIEQGNTRHLYNKQNFLVKFFTMISFKLVDKIINASQGAANDVKNLFNLKDNKVNFVYNFVDFEKIEKLEDQMIEEKIFQNKEKPIILTVCRLDLNQKDLVTLIKAFELVVKKIDSYLIIIGEGPDRKLIEEEIKKINLENKIFLLGYKNNPYKYMKNSDVFVLSSFHEGMPIVLIEAMSCKIPVISTDCNFGSREIVKDGTNGFLVPIGDYQMISEKILYILNNENIREQFILNSQRILNMFDIKKSLEKYKSIIEEVLK